MVSAAALQNPRLMGAMAVRSVLRARTTKIPAADARIPNAGTMSGKTTARAECARNEPPSDVKAAYPRMIDATMVMT